MRFELTIALKYLLPKRRQLSVSIISLISICVISLVVWLIVLFLSVTDGIEKKWIEELVALNAPIRMSPTPAYYQSYYYQIDSISQDSNYATKSIGEKLATPKTDPYDPHFDRELSFDFPSPDKNANGELKDIVKEGFGAILALNFKGIHPQEYEVSFSNVHLKISAASDADQTILTQLSYVASHDSTHAHTNKMVTEKSAADYNNLLKSIAQTSSSVTYNSSDPFEHASDALGEKLRNFFDNLEINELETTADGFTFAPSLFPKKGALKACALIRFNQIARVIVPKTTADLTLLEKRLSNIGCKVSIVDLLFNDNKLQIFSSESYPIDTNVRVMLDEKISFHAHLLEESLKNARSLQALIFEIDGKIQEVPISGKTSFEHLEIKNAIEKKSLSSEPFWVYRASDGRVHIPQLRDSSMGEAVLMAKHFQKNGVRLGDRGYLSYYALSGSATQEQRIPIYVAGFHDPGMIPVGNKLIFVDPRISSILRDNKIAQDPLLGNGIHIWMDDVSRAKELKIELIKSLEARGLSKYWTVESYHDYEFTRPILEQLQSDKNLFTLIAIIILIVACSNIISMLILLVNDKKKEIGILQSMGASSLRIASIFGLCGFVTGLLSSMIGIFAAILTLKHLQAVISILSFLQGHDAFQTAFYGTSLPNNLSFPILGLVFFATLLISLLAGIIPAVKASKVRPTEILRSE